MTRPTDNTATQRYPRDLMGHGRQPPQARWPDNARVAVSGTLVAASASEVVILRLDEQAGDLHLHFPRLGFDVIAA